MVPPSDSLRRILASALLAPSAENRHGVRFRIAVDSVELATTDRAAWAEQPHRQMLALLACGAMIENASLRSGELGLALSSELLPDPQRPDVIAKLRWAPSDGNVDPLVRAIESRHTNRRFYQRNPLADDTLARLTLAAAVIPDARVVWLDTAPRRGLALKAIRIAESERFRRRELHAELFGAVRFEKGWRQTVDEWLPPAALEVEAPMRLPFALMRHWPLMRAATWLGAHHALAQRAAYLPCALAPHIGLVVADDPNLDRGDLAAGRAFQRLWLAAAAEGLALQPMAAATALARQRPGNGWVSVEVRNRLQKLLSMMTEATPNAGPRMLFRLGRASVPSAVTGRRPVDDYLD